MEDNTTKRPEKNDEPAIKDKQIPFEELIVEIRY